MTDSIHPSLQPTAADRIADALRAVTSAVDLVAPGWGSVFGGLIGEVIPNLRDKRSAEYLSQLGRRLAALEVEVEEVSSRMGVEALALFEEGARDSSRATSAERIERIAYIVANGISVGEAQSSLGRDILRLIDDLSDGDIATLAAMAGYVRPPAPQPGETATPDRARLMNALHEMKEVTDLRTARLLSRGLLERKTSVGPDQYRLNDRKAVKLVVERPTITALGRRVLSEVGIIRPWG